MQREHLYRMTVDDMNLEQLQEHIDGVRVRRLATLEVYKQAEEAKKEAKTERLREQANKQLSMFRKELERADAAIDKLDARCTKLKGIMLEMEAL